MLLHMATVIVMATSSFSLVGRSAAEHARCLLKEAEDQLRCLKATKQESAAAIADIYIQLAAAQLSAHCGQVVTNSFCI